MSKYLGKQLLEIDERKPSLNPKEVLAMDLSKASQAIDKKISRDGEINTGELKEIRARVLMELTRSFWAEKEAFETYFPHDELETRLKNSESLVGTIFAVVSNHLEQEFKEAAGKLVEREDLSLPLWIAEISVRHAKALAGQDEISIFQFFLDGIIAGTSISLQFAQLMHLVYEKQYGRKMKVEEMQTALRSQPFLNTAVFLGMSGVHAEHAFFERVKVDDSHCVRGFDPNQFELLDRGGLSILKMKASTEASVQTEFKKHNHGNKGTCPALHIQGNDQSALKEYVAWLSEVLCRHYVPLVCEA
ncbi:MAG: hypothetical protein AAB383_04985 [Patescibacteria group bacterium]